jgi:hypothetical protein
MKTLEPIMKRKLVGTRWNKIWEKQIKNKRLAWQPQEKKKKKKGYQKIILVGIVVLLVI